MDYARRIGTINESATFKYSALAKKPGVIDLTIGRTNFSTPKAIKDACKKALDEDRIHYTPTKGIPELREAIAEKLEKENGVSGLDKEKVLVSAGAKQLIFEAALALIDVGDVAAIPDPSWVSYESIVKFCGGKVAWLPLKAEEGFVPGEAFYSALENSNPKLIMVNSPNNPTGAVFPKKAMERIVDIAARKDAWIMSDEIYEKLIFEGEAFSAASIYDKTLVINGYSKEFSMTGWRLGYAASKDPEIIDKMNMIQGQSVSCATSFVQYAALAAYTPEVREETALIKKELQKRRDFLMEKLSKMESVVCRKPAGAFYAFPCFEGVGDDLALADKFIEHKVAVVPGSPFGPSGKGCVRISYGASDEKELAEATNRIASAVESMK